MFSSTVLDIYSRYCIGKNEYVSVAMAVSVGILVYVIFNKIVCVSV